MGAVVGASGNQSEEDEGYLLFLLGYRDFPSNYGFSDFLYFFGKVASQRHQDRIHSRFTDFIITNLV